MMIFSCVALQENFFLNFFPQSAQISAKALSSHKTEEVSFRVPPRENSHESSVVVV